MSITDAEIAELASRGYVTVLKKSVTLTDAQIKALPTTMVELVAAPGANKLIWPLFLLARVDWHGDYSNIDASARLIFNNGGANELLNEVSNDTGDVSILLAGGGPDGVWAASAARQRLATTVLRAIAGYYDSDIGNVPISMMLDNATSGNLTGGNVSNSMTVTVVHVIIDY